MITKTQYENAKLVYDLESEKMEINEFYILQNFLTYQGKKVVFIKTGYGVEMKFYEED